MENTLYYVKMSNEIYGPYSNEEMENFDIPGDTPVSTDPDSDWSTYSQHGFSTASEELEEPVADNSDAAKDIIVGLLWCIGGIVVTMVTYNNASNGGTYVIAWGAILFGGIQFLKGLFHALF